MECQYRLYYGVRACVCAEGNIAVPLRKMCDTIPLYIITKHHLRTKSHQLLLTCYYTVQSGVWCMWYIEGGYI